MFCYKTTVDRLKIIIYYFTTNYLLTKELSLLFTTKSQLMTFFVSNAQKYIIKISILKFQ